MLATLVIPFQLTMIPTFLVMKQLGLIDTLGGADHPGLVTPFGVFLLRQFFVSLPREIEEAAWIDGCSRLAMLLHVAVPLARPALATVAVLTFLISWNDLLWPLIAINSEEHYTLQLGLDHLPGPAHAVVGGDGRQRDHGAAGRDRVPARAADVHRVADLERGEGMSAMAAIPIERVTKVYDGEVLAVDDVSLEVGDGEFMVLVGPVRLRQVDAAAADRRPRAGDARAGS